MADIDPDTLLEWLTIGTGDERDMQIIALEQLCMLLLMSDNVDRCFESCPPRSFLPALCHIFMDETAPDNILEVTARAITYYLDVSAECSRRIVTVDGAVKALCTRLVVVDISSRTSKDLAEQCVKVLELMCTREAGSIYEAGGLNCMLTFIREYGTQIHKDTLHSAMSVVARLCSKMEPTDETLETCMDSLSKLLQHEDTYVADVALKCFACLADRFIRRGVDPAPLAKHGLTEELLKKLVSSALACNMNTSSSLNASMSESRSSAGNVSIIVSVLSMLCRGSPTVTHDLLRSSLPDAIETAMKGDERCVLDTMRLVDLLLILLFEGRDALPKSTLTSTRNALTALRKLDSTGDKSHRQLIDCIRSKDTDALVEAVESSAFDVNFMDDVGQTLLNWASAFGTLEMVEFLCQRGADVNRGQRSSSLHYAACFGRPGVAKVLLLNGANPELRDEDGKTPLDKARERNDEGHKEVVRILQSPGELMAASLANTLSEKQNENADETKVRNEEDQDTATTETEKETSKVKGDPEMAPLYVKRLVPVFANTYQASLVASIKKATLSILKKMIHYIPLSMMDDLVSGLVAPQLVNVIATALNTEGDDEGHLVAFHCVQDLMSKGGNIFLIHFIRLGVLQKITELSNESQGLNSDEVIDSKIMLKEEAMIQSEDAVKILPSMPYHWHDWCVVRGRDCVYLWSDFCAIELSNGSNGWFRFVLDGKLATMYSSGSPEGGSSSSESRTEFLDKLQRARGSVSSSSISQPILSSAKSNPITVGNWTLSFRQDKQVVIVNTDGQQATILKEDLPGFLFESNRGTKHTFTAETSLGPDFYFSWNGKPGKKFQSKKEQIKQKLASLANSIYCKYFKDADLTPHGSMAALKRISGVLNTCVMNETMTEENRRNIHDVLKELSQLLLEESMLSSYEIQTSGLVTALNNCLNKSSYSTSSLPMVKDRCYSAEIFKKVIGKSPEGNQADSSLPVTNAAMILVQKLITVLESSERLPVLTYESLGGGSGLQILLRRLRFKLERGNRSSNFIDRSGRFLKMEPLTTVKEVEKYLLKTVAKQWFDYDRTSFKIFDHFKDSTEPLIFTYEHDFDVNGILYWVGTNAKNVQDWVNPAHHNIIVVSSSEGSSLPYGRLEDVVSRDSAAVNCHTNDNKLAWFTVDLGLNVIPSAYTLRHSRGYGKSALRNWLLQMSKNGTDWITLKKHENDESLQEPGSTATWQIELPEEFADEREGWSMLRVQQNGVNASGQTYYLSVSGLEVYGKVTSVLTQLKAPPPPEADNLQKRQHRVFRSQILRHMAAGGKESSDWKIFRDKARLKAMAEDNKGNSSLNEGWVDVTWPHNEATVSRVNNENNCQLKVVDISDPNVQAAMQESENQRGKNAANNKSFHHKNLDSALKQVVMTFGRRTDDDKNTGDKKSAENDSRNEDAPPRLDLANLKFLMAVEDLLDSSSSDLVASALAEAASMQVDQLRLATQSFRSALLEPKKPTPSAQGSRESRSPPEICTPPEETAQGNNETKDSTNMTGVENVDRLDSEKTEMEVNQLSSLQSEQDEFDTLSMSKEECLTQIQKITSSMSEVLEAMTLNSEGASYARGNLDDEYDDTQNDVSFSVAENNFLNDNHSVLEPNVITIMNNGGEDCSEDGDEGEEDDDEQLESDMVARDNLENVTKLCTDDKSELKELQSSVETCERTEDKQTDDKVCEDSVNTILDMISNSDNVRDIDAIATQALQLLSKQGEHQENSDKMADQVVISTEKFILNNNQSNETKKDDVSTAEQSNVAGNDRTDSEKTTEMAVGVDDGVSDTVTKEDDDDDSKMYTLEEILEVHQNSKLKKNNVSAPACSGQITDAMKADLMLSENKESESNEEMDIVEDDEDDDDDDDDDDDEDDDDDDDDEFDDIENDEENDVEDMYQPMKTRHHHHGERHYDHQRRMWDDDLVLKCTHSALVPAFDPRPGRANVQQTQDIEIPSEDLLNIIHSKKPSQEIHLYLRGSPYPGAKEVEIPLRNSNATVFSYVQALALHGALGPAKNERLRRVWEPTFTIIYKSASPSHDASESPQEDNQLKWDVSYVNKNLGSLELPKSDVINYLQQNCTVDFLKKWKLTGPTRVCRKQRNCSVLAAAYEEFAQMKMDETTSKPTDVKEKTVFIQEPVHDSLEDIAPIQQVLEVVKCLHRLSEDADDCLFDVPEEEFLSKKLTNKLAQQIQDPVTLTSGSLPLWCEYLVINYPTLFPFETRQMFFKATAFGCSRSIVWLQSMQDAALERSRGHPTRRLETQEFRIGRLKHERVTVPRGEELLETAIRLMDFHAEQKSVLEIEFKDEEGTGLGPSLEFYALISMTIQKNELKLWVSMDELITEDLENYRDIMKYTRHPNGLFPAPFPHDSEKLDEICRMFSFLGIFLAKCLQDNRLVDIPLSAPFFKMLCAGKGKYAKLSRTLSQSSDLTSDRRRCSDAESADEVFDSMSPSESVEKLDSHYFSNVLNDTDFEIIHPNKAKFVKQLRKYIYERQAIMCSTFLNEQERQEQLSELMFVTEHGHSCKLEELGLTFQYVPSSNVYGFDAVPLKVNGEDTPLTSDNVEEYIQLLTDFTMHKGIARQLEAFRAGFNRVFPMEKLHAFKPNEVQLMLCGEQAPQWTYDELLIYTEPKYGYHKDSPGFLRLVNVLVAMSDSEKKDFLQFATGCSSLPPGGIANLHPRLTVVKKEDEGDGSYPSVNTCVHYLKLPEYSSETVLKEKLLAATKEKGFHLN